VSAPLDLTEVQDPDMSLRGVREISPVSRNIRTPSRYFSMAAHGARHRDAQAHTAASGLVCQRLNRMGEDVSHAYRTHDGGERRPQT
jgi:hypothetical protein